MEVLACAKINLSLEVVGRRADGYHDLVGVMQSISLCDTLVFEKKPHNGVSLDTGCDLPADDSNLILRAARAYFEKTKKPFGVDIRLIKRIPMKAGLGGGSADAAATLRALNELDGRRLDDGTLCAIGARLGADVPFCVMGGTRICRGIGEKMTPIENNLKCCAVVVKGEEGVSTPRAFAALDEKYGDFSGFAKAAENDLLRLTEGLKNAETDTVGRVIFNRFEEIVAAEVPGVQRIKQELLALGAFAAQMSGSGPSVFGLFLSEVDAERAAARMRAQGKQAFVCFFT
jgi:4-diphosphocytidyl-2-C-methyl-D-erythritol kinase